MKSPLVFTLLLAAAVVPTSVLAADPSPPGPMLCRPAQSGETSNATMGTAQLSCEPVTVTRSRIAYRRPAQPAADTNRTDKTLTQQTDDTFADILTFPPFPGYYDADQY